jgi:hypothetical protein
MAIKTSAETRFPSGSRSSSAWLGAGLGAFSLVAALAMGCSRGENLIEADKKRVEEAQQQSSAQGWGPGDGSAQTAPAPTTAPTPAPAPPQAMMTPKPAMTPQQAMPASAGAPSTQPSALQIAPEREFVIEGELIGPGDLTLEPGLYRFRVVNRGIRSKYFYLRRSDNGDNGETVVLENIPEMETRDHPVLLEPGEYLYSAPMPPNAPANRLVVR